MEHQGRSLPKNVPVQVTRNGFGSWNIADPKTGKRYGVAQTIALEAVRFDPNANMVFGRTGEMRQLDVELVDPRGGWHIADTIWPVSHAAYAWLDDRGKVWAA